MTNRYKNISQLNVEDNSECNCLPSHHNKHQFFLSKNIILEPSQKYPTYSKNNEESSCGSIKMASLKKSLRKIKGNPFCSPPNKRSSNAYQEYYSPSRALPKEETQDRPILKYKEAEIKKIGPRISFNINRSG